MNNMINKEFTKRVLLGEFLGLVGWASTVGAATLHDVIPPATPLGIHACLDHMGGTLTLMWDKALDADAYNIYRQETLDSTPERINLSPVFIPAFADQWTGRSSYYSVRAADSQGNESGRSLMVFAGEEPKLIYIAEDGVSTVEMPMALSSFFDAKQNGYGVPLALRLIEQPLPANPSTVRAVRLQVVRVDNNQEFPSAVFPSHDVKITIAGQGAHSPLSAATDLKNLSFFWNNGVDWIRRGGTLTDQQNALTLVDANTGDYELRVNMMPQSISLAKAYVTAPLFTPNGDGLNDRVFFNLDNPNNSPLNGRIYDLSGRFVAQLILATQQSGSATLVWSGLDNTGASVPSGLYVYQIEGDNKAVRGTVAVAH